MENYLIAKLKLFEQLNDDGIAILNVDSPATKRIVEHIPVRKIITYGLEKNSDITGTGDKQFSKRTDLYCNKHYKESWQQ